MLGLCALAVSVSAVSDSTSPPPQLYAGAAGSSLGVGQNWYDVTGSRGCWGYYYNNQGRAIQVNINMSIESRGGSASFYVNGALVGSAGNGSSTDNNASFNAVVPDGHYVMVSCNGGRTGIQRWSELR